MRALCCAVPCIWSPTARDSLHLRVCAVLSSYAYLRCLPPADLLELLSVPVCPVDRPKVQAPGSGKVEPHQSRVKAEDFTAALDASHVSRLLVAMARLPPENQEPWLPVLDALLDKALKKHVIAAMCPDDHVNLLCAYPFHVAHKISPVLEDAVHPHKAPQLALRLFRALVERLRDGIHQLTASQLACIARVHVRHWQVRKASKRARECVRACVLCSSDCV